MAERLREVTQRRPVAGSTCSANNPTWLAPAQSVVRGCGLIYPALAQKVVGHPEVAQQERALPVRAGRQVSPAAGSGRAARLRRRAAGPRRRRSPPSGDGRRAGRGANGSPSTVAYRPPPGASCSVSAFRQRSAGRCRDGTCAATVLMCAVIGLSIGLAISPSATASHALPHANRSGDPFAADSLRPAFPAVGSGRPGQRTDSWSPPPRV
jgi:hypothetical protein